MFGDVEKIWHQGKVIKLAFDEYKICMRDVYGIAEEILHSPAATPEEFKVRVDEIPNDFYSLRRNLFSTLFQSVYQLLGLNPHRRLLYGKLNHLFRIWVTSADNLLDYEDKIVVPIKITGSSRVMRQVISIMLADRILKNILDNAVDEGTISHEQAKILTEKSLQILLPSAAEEASEEGGITERPDCLYVLNTIHKLKTGILFHIPVFGPENIEESLNRELFNACRQGLMNFGIGCQLLDDIRDISKDYLEKRHNYVLSDIYHNKPFYLSKLREMEPHLSIDSNIFLEFPDSVCPAADEAMRLLVSGLSILNKIGLDLGDNAQQMSSAMFNVLGVENFSECFKKQHSQK